MINTHRHKFRGISLLELMLALVIIAMIVFTVTRYYSVTEENLKVTQAVEMINNIVKASYQWVEGQPDFKNISIQALIDAGLIPDSYKVNPWKGAVTIPGSTLASVLTINMYDLPRTSCQNLLEKLKGQSKGIMCDPTIPGKAILIVAF